MTEARSTIRGLWKGEPISGYSLIPSVKRTRSPSAERKSEQGQATVEFALMMTLLLGFTFFFFQLSLVFAWGNYVHYATFMSARAYLSAGPTRQDQIDRAKTVASRTLKRGAGMSDVDRFPSIAKGVGAGELTGLQINPPSQFNPSDRAYSWMEGVRYAFRSRLFLIPFAGSSSDNAAPQRQLAGGQAASANAVELTAESWLGREPAHDECVAEMEKKGIWDNGC